MRLSSPESLEFALVQACLQAFTGGGGSQELSRFADSPVAWDTVLRIAAQHGVSGIVLAMLQEKCSERVPKEALQGLRTAAESRLQRILLLTAELRRILDLLTAAFIPVIPIKGPTLAQQLYASSAYREIQDLDFLIRPEHLEEAVRALSNNGYATDLPSDPETRKAYIRARSEVHFTGEAGSLIELHQALLPDFYSIAFDYGSMWRRARQAVFLGREVYQLCPEDTLMFLCAHGAKHGWSRLGWICVVGLLIERKGGEIHWAELIGNARALGIERLVLLGAVLAQNILGVELPAELSSLASSRREVSRLAEGVYGRLERLQPLNELQEVRFFVQCRERMRDKIQYCARLAFTPNEQDYSAIRFPAACSFLYYPFHAARIAGKYGRALWLS